MPSPSFYPQHVHTFPPFPHLPCPPRSFKPKLLFHQKLLSNPFLCLLIYTHTAIRPFLSTDHIPLIAFSENYSTCVLSEMLLQVLLFSVLSFAPRKLTAIPGNFHCLWARAEFLSEPHIRALQVLYFFALPLPVGSVHVLP